MFGVKTACKSSAAFCFGTFADESTPSQADLAVDACHGLSRASGNCHGIAFLLWEEGTSSTNIYPFRPILPKLTPCYGEGGTGMSDCCVTLMDAVDECRPFPLLYMAEGNGNKIKCIPEIRRIITNKLPPVRLSQPRMPATDCKQKI
eukprot:1506072-Pleurochrysis_carterae.AAC.1